MLYSYLNNQYIKLNTVVINTVSITKGTVPFSVSVFQYSLRYIVGFWLVEMASAIGIFI